MIMVQMGVDDDYCIFFYHIIMALMITMIDNKYYDNDDAYMS